MPIIQIICNILTINFSDIESLIPDPSINRLVGILNRDTVLDIVHKSGNPRVWARRAMDVLEEENFPSEAREVDMGHGLSHTFVRTIVDGEFYLVDRFGAGGNEPFVGKEEDAPEYLKDSTPDCINSVRQAVRDNILGTQN